MKVHQMLALLALSAPAITMGGAVVQEKHHFFTNAIYSHYDSNHIFNSTGERKPAYDDFNKDMGTFYLEFGLTNRDTLLGTIGWARIYETLNGRTFGFTDFEIGWKRHIGEYFSHIIATELDAFIPVDKTYAPGLRYGVYGAAANLLASRGFYLCDKLAWYDLRLGYLWYSGFPSDQVLADASFNYHILPQVYLLVGGYLEYGLLNGQSRRDRSLFMFNPNYRLLTGKIEATFCINKGLSIVTGYDRFVWGRNVGTGGRYYCGLQYQL